jgi:hypothetical protein
MMPIPTPNNTVQGQLEQKREGKEQFRLCPQTLFNEQDTARIAAAGPLLDPRSLEEYHPNRERAEQNAGGATAAGEFFLPLESLHQRKQL